MTEASTSLNTWSGQAKQQVRVEHSELKARYRRFLDRKRWQDYAVVFDPGGCAKFGPDPEEGALVGREAIIALLSSVANLGFALQKTGILGLLSPKANKTLAQVRAVGIEEDLFI